MNDFLDRIKKLSPKRIALLALDLQTRLDQYERIETEPIAVIGLGCRLPGGADGPDGFWRLLRDGVDAISEVPPDRWDIDAFFDPDPQSPGKMVTRWGGFLEKIDQFDAKFFGVAPREAVGLDPQQRILLEVVWEAIEHAGQSPDKLMGSRTGVFVGMCAGDYYQQVLRGSPDHFDAYLVSGSAPSMAAGRISYLFGLQGPSFVLDTACSSSLVAVHVACQSLKNSECDMALAGGANLILNPEPTIGLSKAGMLSPEGRCKTFDAEANGLVRGEGCAAVVLKRLSDAKANCDNILAIIRGTAVNQDGRSSGITAPNGPAQEAVIREALERSHIKPAEIDYVETHGTATNLGDPIEVRALSAVLAEGRSKESPVKIGSVKTNLGHLEITAGIAGLIKVVLALEHQQIPPHLHLKKLNPYVEWDDLPVTIPTRNTPWPAGDKRRIAGVSSFGFSGTNAHVIVEEPPTVRPSEKVTQQPIHLLTLSAKSEKALKDLAARYENTFAEKSVQSLGDICFTANSGRTHFKHRLAIMAESVEQLHENLVAFRTGNFPPDAETGRGQGSNPPEVVFLFTGQGSQYVNMGRELYETQPGFCKTIQKCDEILRSYLEMPLISVIYPKSSGDPKTEGLLTQTAFTQPALFALEYASAELWRSWGVEPAMVMGHSVGEYVAACVAGVFNLEDGLKLIAERGRLMQALPDDGAMAAVFADQEQVARAIEPYAGTVSIASANGTDITVISGLSPDLHAILSDFKALDINFKSLNVSHAFHSPLMDPMLDEFEKIASTISYSSPTIGLVSNVTGKPVGASEISNPSYWRRHVRETVKFSASMQYLYEEGYRIFIEAGPNPVLSGMAGKFLPEDTTVWLPTLRKGQRDWRQIIKSIASLYIRGAEIDWDGFYHDYPRQRISLPTYPFQRKRYWIEKFNGKRQELTPSEIEPWRDWLYELKWEPILYRDSSALPHDPLIHPEKVAKPVCWLVLADDGGTGQKLAEVIRSCGQSCISAVKGKSFEIVRKDHFTINPHRAEDYKRLIDVAFGSDRSTYFGVVHLWALDNSFSLDDTPEDIEQTQQHICGSALYLVQALAECNAVSPPRLIIVTRGAQPVRSHLQSIGLAQTSLWGLGKVIALEHPEFQCVCADLDYESSDNEMEVLYDRVLSDTPEERQVAFRHGEYFGLRLDRSDARLLFSDRQVLTLPIDGIYLVTGGLAGLGLLLAQRLVERGARHLILMSRSGASESAKGPIRKMQKAGAEILTVKGDVADVGRLESILTRFSKDERRLRGIFHCAGTIDDGILIKQNWDRFHKVMTSKILGSWNLHVLTRHISLDYFVTFSSGAAMFGSTGQGNYAAANAFMDGLAHYRRSQGLCALSVNWGAWSKVGMASRGGVVERLESQGKGSIDPDHGLRILEHLMQTEIPQVGVLPIHWSELSKALTSLHDSKFLERFHSELESDEKVEQAESNEPPLLQQVSQMPKEKRRDFLLSNVQNQVAKAIGLDRDETIDIDQPLAELGLDSLMAVELRNSLSLWLGKDLPATLLFYYPSLQELVEYLESKALPFIEDQPSDEITATINKSEKDPIKARVNELDKFSESEMAEMLAEKLRAF